MAIREVHSVAHPEQLLKPPMQDYSQHSSSNEYELHVEAMFPPSPNGGGPGARHMSRLLSALPSAAGFRVPAAEDFQAASKLTSRRPLLRASGPSDAPEVKSYRGTHRNAFWRRQLGFYCEFCARFPHALGRPLGIQSKSLADGPQVVAMLPLSAPGSRAPTSSTWG
jgi:hypothetical protein